MSDENPTQKEAHEPSVVTDEEVSVAPVAPEPARPIPVYVVVGLFVAAVLVVLLAVSSRMKSRGLPDEKESLSLIADLEAQRFELNRQRAALGLAPVSGASESVDQIAARLTQDTATLVALSGSFQRIISEKDQEITEKTEALFRSETDRKALAADAERLRDEVRNAAGRGADEERLVREINALNAQRDALVASLDQANERLAGYADARPAADVADLERRLEETTRAKAFFEERVAELERENNNN